MFTHLTRRWYALLSVASAILIATNAGPVQSQSAGAPVSGAVTHSIPTPNMDSIFGSFKLERLGNEKVSIWNDGQEGKRYYYPPSLLPEWDRFHERITEKCAALEGNDQTVVRLRINLNDEYYEVEIRARIAELIGRESLDEHLLNAFPYDNIQIVLKKSAALPSRLLYDRRGRSGGLEEPGVPKIPWLNYPRAISTKVTGSCDSLRQLVSLVRMGEHVLQGRIYFHGVVYETTSFSARLGKYLSSEHSVALFGEETLVRRVNYSNNLEF